MKKSKIHMQRAQIRATNLRDDASRVINYLKKGNVTVVKYLLIDMKKSIDIIEECK